MSQALRFEAPNGAAHSPLRIARAGLSRPALSPSGSGALCPAGPTGRDAADGATALSRTKRKRRDRERTPVNAWAKANVSMVRGRDGEDGPRKEGGNIHYTLGGQIATPDALVQRELGCRDPDDGANYSDADHRRALAWGSSKSPDAQLSDGTADADPLPSQQPTGWSRYAFNTLGGVLGKVWTFCRGATFDGFEAGGGKSYKVQQDAPRTSSQQPPGQDWCNDRDVPTLARDGLEHTPSRFPGSDYAPFLHECETSDFSPCSGPKRRQIAESAAGDELRKNWVMVGQVGEGKRPQPTLSHAEFVRPELNRRISIPVSRLGLPGFQRSSSGRISHAGSATLSSRRPASHAGPRPSELPSGSSSPKPRTPSKLPLPTFNRLTLTSPTKALSSPHPPSRESGIPVASQSYSRQGHHGRHRSLASAASVASFTTPRAASGLAKRRSSVHDLFDDRSPRLDAEAKKMAALRLQQERETDIKINSFNAQLQHMIRQGREALGSTVVLVGDGAEGATGLDAWADDE